MTTATKRGRARARLEVTPLSGALGAEVAGVDLAGPLDDAEVSGLRRALLDHLVIVVRDQALTPQSLLALAARFGEPAEYPFVRGLDGFPLVTPVIKEPDDKVNFGGIWHSDTAYLEGPPMATMLYALETPQAGGDTLFANQYLAYAALSEGMQRMLSGLRAVNTADKPVIAASRAETIRARGEGPGGVATTATHPVVRTHPETGRKALYVNVAHTTHFEGMTEAESKPLLRYLFAHQVRPELTCRLRWRPGSLALWDNRAAQHYAVNDYHGQRRVMHRVTLAGEVPA
jgi:taurine dioxygenase